VLINECEHGHALLLLLLYTLFKLNFTSALISLSDLYQIKDDKISWDPRMTFPSIPTSCISKYQYSINGANVTTVNDPSFSIDSSFTDPQNCASNILTIQPVLMDNNSVLTNVILNGSICTGGNIIRIVPSL